MAETLLRAGLLVATWYTACWAGRAAFSWKEPPAWWLGVSAAGSFAVAWTVG